MDAEFGLVLPLWSYAVGGGELLDRVAGEVGLDHITVPVVTGAQARFRLSGHLEEPYLHTAGGWHFPPASKVYSASGVRPPKARWFASTDHLARVREHAHRLGLRLVLRIDVRAVPAVVEQAPHLAQRNAWDQKVLSAGPCVNHPDLRELLRATLEDLRRYEPAGYELADWMPDHAVDWTTARPLDWHPSARRSLDVCFCASCRQIVERAGEDPDQAARSVRVRVTRMIGAVTGLEGADTKDPVVTSYGAARVTDCGRWLCRLAEGHPGRRFQLLRAFEQASPYEQRSLEELARLPVHIVEHVDEERLEALLRWAQTAGIVGWTQPVWRPSFHVAASLVRVVSEAVRGGLRVFDFEGLDEAAPEAVTWLKQAVRFARRGP